MADRPSQPPHGDENCADGSPGSSTSSTSSRSFRNWSGAWYHLRLMFGSRVRGRLGTLFSRSSRASKSSVKTAEDQTSCTPSATDTNFKSVMPSKGAHTPTCENDSSVAMDITLQARGSPQTVTIKLEVEPEEESCCSDGSPVISANPVRMWKESQQTVITGAVPLPTEISFSQHGECVDAVGEQPPSQQLRRKPLAEQSVETLWKNDPLLFSRPSVQSRPTIHASSCHNECCPCGRFCDQVQMLTTSLRSIVGSMMASGIFQARYLNPSIDGIPPQSRPSATISQRSATSSGHKGSTAKVSDQTVRTGSLNANLEKEPSARSIYDELKRTSDIPEEPSTRSIYDESKRTSEVRLAFSEDLQRVSSVTEQQYEPRPSTHSEVSSMPDVRAAYSEQLPRASSVTDQEYESLITSAYDKPRRTSDLRASFSEELPRASSATKDEREPTTSTIYDALSTPDIRSSYSEELPRGFSETDETYEPPTSSHGELRATPDIDIARSDDLPRLSSVTEEEDDSFFNAGKRKSDLSRRFIEQRNRKSMTNDWFVTRVIETPVLDISTAEIVQTEGEQVIPEDTFDFDETSNLEESTYRTPAVRFKSITTDEEPFQTQMDQQFSGQPQFLTDESDVPNLDWAGSNGSVNTPGPSRKASERQYLMSETDVNINKNPLEYMGNQYPAQSNYSAASVPSSSKQDNMASSFTDLECPTGNDNKQGMQIMDRGPAGSRCRSSVEVTISHSITTTTTRIKSVVSITFQEGADNSKPDTKVPSCHTRMDRVKDPSNVSISIPTSNITNLASKPYTDETHGFGSKKDLNLEMQGLKIHLQKGTPTQQGQGGSQKQNFNNIKTTVVPKSGLRSTPPPRELVQTPVVDFATDGQLEPSVLLEELGDSSEVEEFENFEEIPQSNTIPERNNNQNQEEYNIPTQSTYNWDEPAIKALSWISTKSPYKITIQAQDDTGTASKLQLTLSAGHEQPETVEYSGNQPYAFGQRIGHMAGASSDRTMGEPSIETQFLQQAVRGPAATFKHPSFTKSSNVFDRTSIENDASKLVVMPFSPSGAAHTYNYNAPENEPFRRNERSYAPSVEETTISTTSYTDSFECEDFLQRPYALPPEEPVWNPTFPQNGAQTTYPQDGGQYTFPEDGGQSAYPQYGGQSTFPEDGGQYSYPEDGGQYTYTQDGGQYSYPHDGGQSAFLQNGGQSTAPQNDGQYTYPDDGGQYTYLQEGGQSTYPQGDNIYPQERGQSQFHAEYQEPLESTHLGVLTQQPQGIDAPSSRGYDAQYPAYTMANKDDTLAKDDSSSTSDLVQEQQHKLVTFIPTDELLPKVPKGLITEMRKYLVAHPVSSNNVRAIETQYSDQLTVNTFPSEEVEPTREPLTVNNESLDPAKTKSSKANFSKVSVEVHSEDLGLLGAEFTVSLADGSLGPLKKSKKASKQKIKINGDPGLKTFECVRHADLPNSHVIAVERTANAIAAASKELQILLDANNASKKKSDVSVRVVEVGIQWSNQSHDTTRKIPVPLDSAEALEGGIDIINAERPQQEQEFNQLLAPALKLGQVKRKQTGYHQRQFGDDDIEGEAMLGQLGSKPPVYHESPETRLSTDEVALESATGASTPIQTSSISEESTKVLYHPSDMTESDVSVEHPISDNEISQQEENLSESFTSCECPEKQNTQQHLPNSNEDHDVDDDDTETLHNEQLMEHEYPDVTSEEITEHKSNLSNSSKRSARPGNSLAEQIMQQQLPNSDEDHDVDNHPETLHSEQLMEDEFPNNMSCEEIAEHKSNLSNSSKRSARPGNRQAEQITQQQFSNSDEGHDVYDDPETLRSEQLMEDEFPENMSCKEIAEHKSNLSNSSKLSARPRKSEPDIPQDINNVKACSEDIEDNKDKDVIKKICSVKDLEFKPTASKHRRVSFTDEEETGFPEKIDADTAEVLSSKPPDQKKLSGISKEFPEAQRETYNNETEAMVDDSLENEHQLQEQSGASWGNDSPEEKPLSLDDDKGQAIEGEEDEGSYVPQEVPLLRSVMHRNSSDASCASPKKHETGERPHKEIDDKVDNSQERISLQKASDDPLNETVQHKKTSILQETPKTVPLESNKTDEYNPSKVTKHSSTVGLTITSNDSNSSLKERPYDNDDETVVDTQDDLKLDRCPVLGIVCKESCSDKSFRHKDSSSSHVYDTLAPTEDNYNSKQILRSTPRSRRAPSDVSSKKHRLAHDRSPARDMEDREDGSREDETLTAKPRGKRPHSKGSRASSKKQDTSDRQDEQTRDMPEIKPQPRDMSQPGSMHKTSGYRKTPPPDATGLRSDYNTPKGALPNPHSSQRYTDTANVSSENQQGRGRRSRGGTVNDEDDSELAGCPVLGTTCGGCSASPQKGYGPSDSIQIYQSEFPEAVDCSSPSEEKQNSSTKARRKSGDGSKTSSKKTAHDKTFSEQTHKSKDRLKQTGVPVLRTISEGSCLERSSLYDSPSLSQVSVANASRELITPAEYQQEEILRSRPDIQRKSRKDTDMPSKKQRKTYDRNSEEYKVDSQEQCPVLGKGCQGCCCGTSNSKPATRGQRNVPDVLDDTDDHDYEREPTLLYKPSSQPNSARPTGTSSKRQKTSDRHVEQGTEDVENGSSQMEVPRPKKSGTGSRQKISDYKSTPDSDTCEGVVPQELDRNDENHPQLETLHYRPSTRRKSREASDKRFKKESKGYQRGHERRSEDTRNNAQDVDCPALGIVCDGSCSKVSQQSTRSTGSQKKERRESQRSNDYSTEQMLHLKPVKQQKSEDAVNVKQRTSGGAIEQQTEHTVHDSPNTGDNVSQKTRDYDGYEQNEHQKALSSDGIQENQPQDVDTNNDSYYVVETSRPEGSVVRRGVSESSLKKQTAIEEIGVTLKTENTARNSQKEVCPVLRGACEGSCVNISRKTKSTPSILSQRSVPHESETTGNNYASDETLRSERSDGWKSRNESSGSSIKEETFDENDEQEAEGLDDTTSENEDHLLSGNISSKLSKHDEVPYEAGTEEAVTRSFSKSDDGFPEPDTSHTTNSKDSGTALPNTQTKPQGGNCEPRTEYGEYCVQEVGFPALEKGSERSCESKTQCERIQPSDSSQGGIPQHPGREENKYTMKEPQSYKSIIQTTSSDGTGISTQKSQIDGVRSEGKAGNVGDSQNQDEWGDIKPTCEDYETKKFYHEDATDHSNEQVTTSEIDLSTEKDPLSHGMLFLKPHVDIASVESNVGNPVEQTVPNSGQNVMQDVEGAHSNSAWHDYPAAEVDSEDSSRQNNDQPNSMSHVLREISELQTMDEIQNGSSSKGTNFKSQTYICGCDQIPVVRSFSEPLRESGSPGGYSSSAKGGKELAVKPPRTLSKTKGPSFQDPTGRERDSENINKAPSTSKTYKIRTGACSLITCRKPPSKNRECSCHGRDEDSTDTDDVFGMKGHVEEDTGSGVSDKSKPEFLDLLEGNREAKDSEEMKSPGRNEDDELNMEKVQHTGSKDEAEIQSVSDYQLQSGDKKVRLGTENEPVPELSSKPPFMPLKTSGETVTPPPSPDIPDTVEPDCDVLSLTYDEPASCPENPQTEYTYAGTQLGLERDVSDDPASQMQERPLTSKTNLCDGVSSNTLDPAQDERDIPILLGQQKSSECPYMSRDDAANTDGHHTSEIKPTYQSEGIPDEDAASQTNQNAQEYNRDEPVAINMTHPYECQCCVCSPDESAIGKTSADTGIQNHDGDEDPETLPSEDIMQHECPDSMTCEEIAELKYNFTNSIKPSSRPDIPGNNTKIQKEFENGYSGFGETSPTNMSDSNNSERPDSFLQKKPSDIKSPAECELSNLTSNSQAKLPGVPSTRVKDTSNHTQADLPEDITCDTGTQIKTPNNSSFTNIAEAEECGPDASNLMQTQQLEDDANTCTSVALPKVYEQELSSKPVVTEQENNLTEVPQCSSQPSKFSSESGELTEPKVTKTASCAQSTEDPDVGDYVVTPLDQAKPSPAISSHEMITVDKIPNHYEENGTEETEQPTSPWRLEVDTASKHSLPPTGIGSNSMLSPQKASQAANSAPSTVPTQSDLTDDDETSKPEIDKGLVHKPLETDTNSRWIRGILSNIHYSDSGSLLAQEVAITLDVSTAKSLFIVVSSQNVTTDETHDDGVSVIVTEKKDSVSEHGKPKIEVTITSSMVDGSSTRSALVAKDSTRYEVDQKSSRQEIASEENAVSDNVVHEQINVEEDVNPICEPVPFLARPPEHDVKEDARTGLLGQAKRHPLSDDMTEVRLHAAPPKDKKSHYTRFVAPAVDYKALMAKPSGETHSTVRQSSVSFEDEESTEVVRDDSNDLPAIRVPETTQEDGSVLLEDQAPDSTRDVLSEQKTEEKLSLDKVTSPISMQVSQTSDDENVEDFKTSAVEADGPRASADESPVTDENDFKQTLPEEQTDYVATKSSDTVPNKTSRSPSVTSTRAETNIVPLAKLTASREKLVNHTKENSVNSVEPMELEDDGTSNEPSTVKSSELRSKDNTIYVCLVDSKDGVFPEKVAGEMLLTVGDEELQTSKTIEVYNSSENLSHVERPQASPVIDTEIDPLGARNVSCEAKLSMSGGNKNNIIDKEVYYKHYTSQDTEEPVIGKMSKETRGESPDKVATTTEDAQLAKELKKSSMLPISPDGHGRQTEDSSPEKCDPEHSDGFTLDPRLEYFSVDNETPIEKGTKLGLSPVFITAAECGVPEPERVATAGSISTNEGVKGQIDIQQDDHSGGTQESSGKVEFESEDGKDRYESESRENHKSKKRERMHKSPRRADLYSNESPRSVRHKRRTEEKNDQYSKEQRVKYVDSGNGSMKNSERIPEREGKHTSQRETRIEESTDSRKKRKGGLTHESITTDVNKYETCDDLFETSGSSDTSHAVGKVTGRKPYSTETTPITGKVVRSLGAPKRRSTRESNGTSDAKSTMPASTTPDGDRRIEPRRHTPESILVPKPVATASGAPPTPGPPPPTTPPQIAGAPPTNPISPPQNSPSQQQPQLALSSRAKQASPSPKAEQVSPSPKAAKVSPPKKYTQPPASSEYTGSTEYSHTQTLSDYSESTPSPEPRKPPQLVSTPLAPHSPKPPNSPKSPPTSLTPESQRRKPSATSARRLWPDSASSSRAPPQPIPLLGTQRRHIPPTQATAGGSSARSSAQQETSMPDAAGVSSFFRPDLIFPTIRSLLGPTLDESVIRGYDLLREGCTTCNPVENRTENPDDQTQPDANRRK